MENASGTFGGMDARAASKVHLFSTLSGWSGCGWMIEGSLTYYTLPRSAQQVTERLDRLIEQIRNVQAPCFNGESHADVVLV